MRVSESPMGGLYAALPALAGTGAAMMRQQLTRFATPADHHPARELQLEAVAT